jgi:hypothetical protein
LHLGALRRVASFDELLSSGALLLMVLIPLWEILMRPLSGGGIQNAPVLVQHLGLVLAMFGALAAERHGHLTSLVGQGSGAAPHRFAGAEERPHHVDAQNVMQTLRAHFVDAGPTTQDARIVDQRGERPKGLIAGGKQALDVGLYRHIRLHRERAPAQAFDLCHHTGGGSGVFPITQCHGIAGARRAQGGGRPNAAAAAGDQQHFIHG